MIPEKPTREQLAATIEGAWRAWANRNYPFDAEWERWLTTRTELPAAGSEAQLNDLRGLRDRALAGHMAQLWFHCTENAGDIAAELRASRDRDREKERQRLVRCCKQALDGKLGNTKQEMDEARAVAQRFVNGPPESCSYDDLRDWEKLHQHAKRVAAGEKAARPVLSIDRKRKADQARRIVDLDAAIGAAQAGRPSPTQERLWGGE